jgi:hypothetical protein
MGTCIYCGKPAGLLRKQHPECKARHSNAYSVIPEFFGKVIDSAITPQRFSELLQAAARESYVETSELKKLCRTGFSNAISSILNDRMLTATELQRVNELVDALGTNFPGGLELDELLAKIGVIVELGEGKIPDCVSIAEPVPIEFESGESVVWIFNQATLFRSRRRKRKETNETKTTNEPVTFDGRYRGPREIEKAPFPRERFAEEATGDLLLTDRNLYFLRSARSSVKMQMTGIQGVQAYAEAVTLMNAQDDEPPRTFLLDDAWFAGNALQRLSQLSNAAAQ